MCFCGILRCTKCGKHLSGEVIMNQDGIYHKTCFDDKTETEEQPEPQTCCGE